MNAHIYIICQEYITICALMATHYMRSTVSIDLMVAIE